MFFAFREFKWPKQLHGNDICYGSCFRNISCQIIFLFVILILDVCENNTDDTVYTYSYTFRQAESPQRPAAIKPRSHWVTVTAEDEGLFKCIYTWGMSAYWCTWQKLTRNHNWCHEVMFSRCVGAARTSCVSKFGDDRGWWLCLYSKWAKLKACCIIEKRSSLITWLVSPIISVYCCLN